MSSAVASCFSTKITWPAPRLSASIPTAPVPAKRSIKLEPATRSPRILKSVSRNRSLVGRSRDPAPREEFYFENGRRQFASSSHFRQLISASPGRAQPRGQCRKFSARRRIFRKRKRFSPGQFQQLAIPQRICDVESQQSVLPRAEKFAGTAQPQIASAISNPFEVRTIVSNRSRASPSNSFGATRIQYGFLAAASDTPAQLMQLRKPEALRMFDDHHRRVRDVDANLYHRCSNQILQLPRRNSSMTFSFSTLFIRPCRVQL